MSEPQPAGPSTVAPSPVSAAPSPTAVSSPVSASVAPPPAVPLGSRTWNTVNQPGAYVCNDTGRLLRVHANGVKEGTCPIVEFIGPNGSPMVTRLSENPGLPIAELRTICAGTTVKAQF
jgi:hypothetical protein